MKKLNSVKRKDIFSDLGVARIEKIKIMLQYIIMIVCSVVLGWVTVKLLPDSFLSSVADGIPRHFGSLFENCESFRDGLLCVISYSRLDLLAVSMIAISVFTVFNCLISDFVLVFRGFCFGFCCSYLTYFPSVASEHGVGIFRFLIYSFFKIVIASLLLLYSYRSSLYAMGMKKYTPVGRTVIDKRLLMSFILFTVAMLGAVMIVQGIYCLTIFLLK